jgi:endonuclease/exonuclease/phosphatase family metal-dependent hydrolase
MNFRKLFLITLLPAVLVLQGCGPQDVINPVTPPSTNEGGEEPPTPPSPGGDAVSMIVCSFNIRYANTSDTYPDGSSAAWSARRESVKKFVDTVKPDLIGLQEVRKAQSEDFNSYFGAEYGYYDVGRDSGSGASVASANCEGVGVLYRKDRFELLSKDFFWLDAKPRELPAKNADGTYGAWNSACRRVTVYVKLKDKKNGATVWFFPTHYDHKSADARKNAADLNYEQIKALCKVDDVKNAGVVILHVGDLNTTYDSAQLKTLNDNMFYARNTAAGNDRGTGTYNGFGDKSSIIDHIYYGGKAVKPVKYWVDKTDYGVPYLSDHYPILFQWEYQ